MKNLKTGDIISYSDGWSYRLTDVTTIALGYVTGCVEGNPEFTCLLDVAEIDGYEPEHFKVHHTHVAKAMAIIAMLIYIAWLIFC